MIKGLIMKIILVVDMQLDFMEFSGAKLPVPDTREIILNANEYLYALKPIETQSIVFTQDWHTSEWVEHAENGDQFPQHCIENTPGAEILLNRNMIHPAIPQYFLRKNTFDMWAGKPQPMYNQIDMSYVGRDTFFCPSPWSFTVEVFGIASDFCVDAAIKGLLQRGYTVNVIEHLCRGIAKDIRTVVKEKYDGKVNLI